MMTAKREQVYWSKENQEAIQDGEQHWSPKELERQDDETITELHEALFGTKGTNDDRLWKQTSDTLMSPQAQACTGILRKV